MRGKSLLCVLAMVSVGLLAGCDKTYKITVTNVTPTAHEIAMKDPNGFHQFGKIAPGDSVRYSLKLPQDELPAQCELRVDGTAKPFILEKNDKDNQYFYIDASGVVGPTDERREYKSSTRIETRSTRTGGEVITGDGAPAPSGGGRIIEQREVVE